MDRVPQTEVVRHWLRVEAEKPGVEVRNIDRLQGPAAVDALLELKPGAAAFIWRDEPVTWYRCTVSRRAFLDLHVIAGPADRHWRALADDGTVRSAAARVATGEPSALTAATGVDVTKILDIRDGLPGVADRDLVLATRRGCVPRRIADGNYRAVAKALFLRDGGGYRPQRVYLGVGANPVLAPLRERVCGILRRDD